MTNPITIVQEGARFIARFPFNLQTKDVVKAVGFRWDPIAKIWWTQDSDKADRLRARDLDTVVEQLNGLAREQHERDAASIEESKAANSNLDIPVPDGLEYLPYQKAGIAYALGRENTLIGDEMGLGKTIQVLGLINADPSLRQVLVICPASLKLNWAREAEKWLVRRFKIEDLSVADLRDSPSNWSRFVITNYEQVKKYRTALDGVAWDLLVCDEIHYMKNPNAQRTIKILGKWDRNPEKRQSPIKARKKVFLSGTPIPNRPVEIWPIVHALDPKGLGKSWFNFVNRYCAAGWGGYGMEYGGSSNLDELQAKLRASIMVRRKKADVLTELPPKRRQVVVVPQGVAAGAVAAENRAWQELERNLTDLRAQVEISKASEDSEEYNQAVARLRDAERVAFTEIAKLRHRTALAKVPIVLEHVLDLLENTDRLVVMCHHHDVVEALSRGIEGCVTLTGATPLRKRQGAVDRFQNDPTCRLFVGTIGAAGVGITLTAASTMVFAELDWVPGNLTQAEDRIHRIGQNDRVLIQHIVLDGSLDSRMAKTLVAKQEVLDKALDKGAVLPEIRILELPVFRPETSSTTRSRLDPIAEGLSDSDVLRVHDALRALAGVCDGAIELDNQGFNSADAALGHRLANFDRLTKRQAALGIVMLRKYHRQIGGLISDLLRN